MPLSARLLTRLVMLVAAATRFTTATAAGLSASSAFVHGGALVLRGARRRCGDAAAMSQPPCRLGLASCTAQAWRPVLAARGRNQVTATASFSRAAGPHLARMVRMQATVKAEETGLWAGEGETFASLGIHENLAQALAHLGFTRPTRIQAATLPAILGGQDVVIGAETGSGKTLAYMLPALQKVLPERTDWDKRPEVLVLVPNQELARQVTAVVRKITGTNDALEVPVTMLAGSSGLSQSATCAILVATPSAILRNTSPSYLDQVHTVIVDEADMLLDGGFVADVTRILDFLCPRLSNTALRRLAKEGKTADDGKDELERQPAQVVFAAATLPDWKGDKVKSVVRMLRKRFPDAQHITTEQLHKQSVRGLHI